jgi:hypothetical protein
MQGQVKAVGIGWYARQDYQRILDVMEDSDKLPTNYDRWVRSAETGERQLSKQGIKVVRAWIAPDQFVAWCKAQGLRCNAEARMRWGSEFAFRSLTGGHQADH